MKKTNKSTKIDDVSRAVAGYLKRPYQRLLTPEEDGTFRGEIAEFPGCLSVGETAAAALAQLEEVAASWIESMLATKQPIQPPQEISTFSGKLVVRMPKSLHQRAAVAAQRDGVSLNQLIVTCIAEHVGAQKQQMNYRLLSTSGVHIHTTQSTIDVTHHGFLPTSITTNYLQVPRHLELEQEDA